jgi:hypothetical protein
MQQTDADCGKPGLDSVMKDFYEPVRDSSFAPEF